MLPVLQTLYFLATESKAKAGPLKTPTGLVQVFCAVPFLQCNVDIRVVPCRDYSLPHFLGLGHFCGKQVQTFFWPIHSGSGIDYFLSLPIFAETQSLHKSERLLKRVPSFPCSRENALELRGLGGQCFPRPPMALLEWTGQKAFFLFLCFRLECSKPNK